jgi:hypothetical protein
MKPTLTYIKYRSTYVLQLLSSYIYYRRESSKIAQSATVLALIRNSKIHRYKKSDIKLANFWLFWNFCGTFHSSRKCTQSWKFVFARSLNKRLRPRVDSDQKTEKCTHMQLDEAHLLVSRHTPFFRLLPSKKSIFSKTRKSFFANNSIWGILGYRVWCTKKMRLDETFPTVYGFDRFGP